MSTTHGFHCHCSDVIMSAMASQITGVSIVYRVNRLFRHISKKTSKLRVSCHLWGEFTGDRWILRTNGKKRGKCFDLMTSSCHLQVCLLTMITLFIWIHRETIQVFLFVYRHFENSFDNTPYHLCQKMYCLWNVVKWSLHFKGQKCLSTWWYRTMLQVFTLKLLIALIKR